MKKTDEPGPAPEEPRQRISSLSETILRINASLDVATVLRRQRWLSCGEYLDAPPTQAVCRR